MPEIYLTPASISYLNQFLLAFLITIYLGLHFSDRQQSSIQDRLLVFFFVMVTLLSFALFLDVSLLPSERLLVVYLESTMLALLLIVLIQFAYFFPAPRENQKVERWLALIFTSAYMLLEAGFALWRFGLLRQGQVEFRPDYLDYAPVLGFAWAVLVFARGTVRNWNLPASRRFAMIFAIPVYLTALNLLYSYHHITTSFYHISISIGILFTLFLFALNYLASKPESTSLMVKFSGAILTCVLAVFGTIPWLVAPTYATQYKPAVIDQRSIRFSPNQRGGYDVAEIPFHFEQDLGQNLGLSDDPKHGPVAAGIDFDFPFYGHRYQRLFISNDGLVSFGDMINFKDLEYHFSKVPAIFALLLDLYPEISTDGGIFLRRDLAQLVITYDRIKAFNHPELVYTFQIILHSDGSFDITYNGLPQNQQYYVNDRPDAAIWAIGAKPAQTPQQTPSLVGLPVTSGPEGVLQDENRAFRQFLHNFLHPLAIAVLFSSLLFMVGLPLALNFVLARPLNALLKGVAQINQGQSTQNIPVQFNDEIGFLTQSFNYLTGELDSVIQNLEMRVTGRTAELLTANDQLRKLSIAVEQSPSTIIITDQKATIEYVNPAFTRSTGYSFTEVQGKNPRILKSDLTPAETYTEMWTALTDGKTWRGELCNRKKNGLDFWEYTVIAPIYDDHGDITHYVAIKEDITERKIAEKALVESEEQYRKLFEMESDAIFIIRNADGAILEANSAAVELYGFSYDELLRMHNTDLSAEPEVTQQATNSPLPMDQVIVIPLRWHRKKDGIAFPVEITARFIEWRGYAVHIAAIRDVSERKKAEEAIAKFSHFLANLNNVTMKLSLAPTFDELCYLAIKLGQEELGFDRIGLWFIDPEDPDYMVGSYGVDEKGNIRDERKMRILSHVDDVNEQLMNDRMHIYYHEHDQIFNDGYQGVGYGEHAAVGLWDGNTVIGFLYTDNYLDGEPINEHRRELLMLYGQAIGHQGTIKRAQQQLEQLAITDPLTRLYNRRHFFAEAEKIFLRSSYPPFSLAAIMLDIDYFKQVNDTFGHSTGDLVLQIIAQRLQQNLRPTDLLGRYGGEEFVALLPRTQFADVARVAERLLKSINDSPVVANGFSIAVTISIGIAPLKEHTNSLDELVSNADQALYLAKNSGRNRWAFLDENQPAA